MSNLIVVRAPNDFPLTLSRTRPSLFMAGGISNCPDWQELMIERCSHLDAIFINPRRYDFDVMDPKQSDIQIEWEHCNLEIADIVSFWFPEETLCPITLFELGKIAMSDKPMVVGVHPGYKRKFDVIKQLSIIRPEIEVIDNLDGFFNEVQSVILNWDVVDIND